MARRYNTCVMALAMALLSTSLSGCTPADVLKQLQSALGSPSSGTAKSRVTVKLSPKGSGKASVGCRVGPSRALATRRPGTSQATRPAAKPAARPAARPTAPRNAGTTTPPATCPAGTLSRADAPRVATTDNSSGGSGAKPFGANSPLLNTVTNPEILESGATSRE